jgi:hypothetical protein
VNNTIVEARDAQGNVTRIGSLRGGTGHVALDADGRGFYFAAGGSLKDYQFGGEEPQTVGPFKGGQVALGAVRDGMALYAAADAKLWRIALPGGAAQEIAWQAHVKMEVAEAGPPKWMPLPGPAFRPRAILTPRLSPDGKTLVFMAAGALWEQPASGGEAKNLLEEGAFQLEPAMSPDGTQIAFISDKKGVRELRVLDLAMRRTRTLTTVPSSAWLLFPSWSSDQKSIIVQRTDAISDPYRLLRVSLSGGEPVQLAQTGNSWNAGRIFRPTAAPCITRLARARMPMFSGCC